MTCAWKRVLSLAFAVVLTGCSWGTITTDDKQDGRDARVDSLVLSDSQIDQGGQPPDAEPQPADGSVAADLQQPPDQGSDAIPGVGEPCPCASGLYCYNGVCLARCAAPADPCGAVSSCQATERCVELINPAGTFICLPTGLVIGDVCGDQAFCPNETICAWYSESQTPGTPRCLPLCAQAGTSCGSGAGQCVSTTDGCLFCSHP